MSSTSGCSTSGYPWSGLLDEPEVTALRRYQRPRPTAPELVRPALLVIDVVPSFLGPDRPVLEAQEASRQACGVHGWRRIPTIRGLLSLFRDHGWPVMFTVVSPLQGHIEQSKRPTPRAAAPEGDDLWSRSDVVVQQLAPASDEPIVGKTRSSAFFGTPLNAMLVRLGIQTLVLAGCTTSGCVLASAIDACSNGFDVVVDHEACFDRVPTLHDAALVTMDAKWAWVMGDDEIRRALTVAG